MYIHLIKLKELPENVYKFLQTDMNVEKVKEFHNMFYTIEDVFTYTIENIDQKIILQGMELFKIYKMNGFIYCYDLERFEQMLKYIEDFDECLYCINTEPSSLKMTKRESKKIYEIIKYFIDVSDKQNLFMSSTSLENLKNFDENVHKIYLDDNSTIVCTTQNGDDIDDTANKFDMENFYLTILDGRIYLSKSLNEFIELGNPDLNSDLSPEELSTLLDSLNSVEILSEPTAELATPVQTPVQTQVKKLATPIVDLLENKENIDPNNFVKSMQNEPESVEPYNSGDENMEPISSNYTRDYINNDKIKMTMEEIEKEREKELKVPTTLKSADENVNFESNIEEDEVKIIEKVIRTVEDDKSGILLFVKNNVLEKSMILTNDDQINCIKEVPIFPEIEYIIEYIIPDIEEVSKLLDIKLKNIDNLTLDIIDKNIMKINEFLYSDETKNITANSNKYSRMLSLVRDFMVKNCIRKKGSKVYSTQLYLKFYDNLLLNAPQDVVYFNKNNFTPLLKKLNYKTKRDRDGVYWLDLEFKEKKYALKSFYGY